MCEGFVTPDAGTVRVLGLDPIADSGEVRSRIGVMLQGGGAYPGSKAGGEMLDLVAAYSATRSIPPGSFPNSASPMRARPRTAASPEASSNDCPWRARWSAVPNWYFWTNPPPASTLRHVYSCGNSSTLCDATA